MSSYHICHAILSATPCKQTFQTIALLRAKLHANVHQKLLHVLSNIGYLLPNQFKSHPTPSEGTSLIKLLQKHVSTDSVSVPLHSVSTVS